ncbi:hypothetical protein JCM11251_005566 [Rhodosporidiobolus azoricus]
MSAPSIQFTTASPAHSSHSTSSAQSAQSIEPMHVAADEQAQLPQGSGVNGAGQAPMGGLGAKGFLMKKMAAAGQNFHSPTDTMVSPCTKKLAQSKQRHFTKGKPLSLSSSFQAQAQQQQKAPSKLSGLGHSSSLASNEGENASPF